MPADPFGCAAWVGYFGIAFAIGARSASCRSAEPVVNAAADQLVPSVAEATALVPVSDQPHFEPNAPGSCAVPHVWCVPSAAKSGASRIQR